MTLEDMSELSVLCMRVEVVEGSRANEGTKRTRARGESHLKPRSGVALVG